MNLRPNTSGTQPISPDKKPLRERKELLGLFFFKFLQLKLKEVFFC